MPDSSDQDVRLKIIGHIHTPFKDSEAIPVQGTANTARGSVALLPHYAEGLGDLEGFDRIWLLYRAQIEQSLSMTVVPRLDETRRGVFASRSMLRPNPIGMTCVKFLRVQSGTVHVEGVDMLDGTPLLDIKPYVPRYDAYPDAWAGWLENVIPAEDAWQGDRNDA